MRDHRSYLGSLMGTTLLVLSLACAGCSSKDHVAGPVPAPAPPTLVLTLDGSAAENPEPFAPVGVAVGPEGTVYVADLGNLRVLMFTSAGDYLGQWGSQGGGPGQFVSLGGLAADAHGDVYVVDPGGHRVEKFTSGGTFLAQWGSEGRAKGEFSYPWDVAVDDSNQVYVADSDNSRIQKFTSAGVYLSQWNLVGSPFSSEPAGIGLDSHHDLHAPRGFAFVTDRSLRWVCKFTLEGTLVTSWAGGGILSGPFLGPVDVAVTRDGGLLVLDNYGCTIERFSRDGESLGAWGGSGSEPGQLRAPWALVVDNDDYVYVADYGNHRVQKFGPVR